MSTPISGPLQTFLRRPTDRTARPHPGTFSHADIIAVAARSPLPRWGESVFTLLIGSMAASCGLFVIVTRLARMMHVSLVSPEGRWLWLAILGEVLGGLGYAWSLRGRRGRSFVCVAAGLICGAAILLMGVSSLMRGSHG